MITTNILRAQGYTQQEAATFFRRMKDSFGVKLHNIKEETADQSIAWNQAISIDDAITFLESYVPTLEHRKTSKPSKWKKLLRTLKRLKQEKSNNTL